MKNRFIIIFIALCFVDMVSYAQKVSGLVRDLSSEPISFANVVLCNAADTSQVNYTITDLDGKFTFSPKEQKNYLLHISFLGYKPRYVNALADQVIVLEQDNILINEVVVKGSKPISKITASGVQTTIANTVLSNMGSGNDVLKRIPMLKGDNGSFEVFGRGAAKIYINNREVRDPSELDKLNSTEIQNVEVISNPGARYDASVKAVIHIKTVRKQGDGFGFDVRSSFYTWENQDYINQINTNYRKGGLDLFANVYYSDVQSLQWGDLSQTTTLDTLWQQKSYNNRAYYRNNLNGTLGANYEINKNHYVGFRYDITTSPKPNVQNEDFTSDIYADGAHFDHWKNNERKEQKNKIGSRANLYYSGKFKKLSIDFNADYLNSGSTSININTEKTNQYADRTLHSISEIDNRLWAGKLQLAYQYGKENCQ